MASRLCRFLLTFIGNVILYALLIALLGGVFLFLALLFGGLFLWASSPTVVGVLAAIFAHPFWGKLAAFGLVLFVGGLLLAFAMIVLYVLVLVVCCSVAGRDNVGVSGRRDACDCGPLCLLGPLFPAAAFLILVLVITPILLLGVGADGLGVSPDALLNAARWLLVVFGLLLALAPFIWCCCRGCKGTSRVVKTRGDVFSESLGVDPSEDPGYVDPSENT